LLAVLVTARASSYLSRDPETFLEQQRETYVAHLTPLMLHVGGAVVALPLGLLQFISGLRSRWPRVHRAIGRVYLLAVLATGVGGLLLAPTTYTGRLAGLAFALLALSTLASTVMAFVAIRRRQIARHRVWMTRSYALIFTGVSFRLCLVLLPVLGLSFDDAYAVGAWVAWPINLAVAEVCMRRTRRSPRRPVSDHVSSARRAPASALVATSAADSPEVPGSCRSRSKSRSVTPPSSHPPRATMCTASSSSRPLTCWWT
jgi:uncharacterized membrane protein